MNTLILRAYNRARCDPDKLMKEYEAISKQFIIARDLLKKELIKALGEK